MGRHSRKGRAPKGDTSEKSAAAPAGPPPAGDRGVPRGYEGASGPPGLRRLPDGTPAHGFPRRPEGPSGRGVPRFPDGTSAHGFPRLPDGTPAHGFPRLPDGRSGQGVPRFPDGTPAHGFPRLPDGTPGRGFPQSRGGHPEQREAGGGWGRLGGETRPHPGDGQGAYGAPSGAPYGAPGGPSYGAQHGESSGSPSGAPGQGQGRRIPIPRQRQEAVPPPPGGPRQAYLDAFDEEQPPTGDPGEGKDTGKSGKGRAFAGIAAAAVTTVLAVIVGGQVTGGQEDTTARAQAADAGDRDVRGASRSDDRPTPSSPPRVSAAPLSYDEKMGQKYALAADLEGNGKFQTVRGFDKAPGTGRKYRYRVDVEEGLGLDAELFAQAVQKTLNDDRSWAHNGGRTFERISSGKPDFVITLASPGTTAVWCAKSGLDTTVDNVSCDSAATERVMINAYRWAQGSKTYGDRIHAYRQMLINHEIGHRLGYSHVTCDKDGDLAPVMQQQSKFLSYDGITCKANPWAFPGG
ncbi:DUF3152 domain-containing protein [Streptomyces neyagawaensis]|uniref:DUF3152 domain-containing protein n=1 Tax=Streptomyces neyagawaensis TaxID=42238 RepID=UPI00099E7F18|nr:DUF3152 domain-containing protein [Streptomyces neyagawaensis]MCL6737826.1 DUF3152 domain-containing protein [Streptomyces neyagawaensis]MDE1680798.1 DUF3152 domain-containing protein [Streptomyces neyagawaensis]